ncbi:MAG: DUF3536 domain-containing protein [Candidatus Eisenbacteria bacterium]|nr:DUF3536 domain-containing protein [Candidatus Eisenbacteria bacterium]
MAKRDDAVYLIIHGHFYQPPRENPWLRTIDRQESAAPYHDWNERILAECYRPNTRSRLFDNEGRIRGIANNLENISFNFGPTLFRYIEREDPDTYRRILEADRSSVERHGGHGNAVAQAYHHVILPLAGREDRRTLVRWGLADFEKRYGRRSEGLWLPETAVNNETAADLAREGIRFLLLSPHQAERVRPLGGAEKDWKDVSSGSVDTRRPYRLFPDPKEPELSIDILFYDAGLSTGVSFEHFLRNAHSFGEKLRVAAGDGALSPRLIHVSTDGEVYGHHEPFADMCLSALFDGIAAELGLTVTNPGEFLDLVKPAWEAELKGGPKGEGTAWSCGHGLGRWSRDCGCSISHKPDWNQKWRTPLREGLNLLREDLGALFDREATGLLRDPDGAAERYVDVLFEGNRASWERFLAAEASRPLSPPEEERACRLLEMTHGALRMFTSCGWFFDDIAGIEAVQNLLFAAHTLDLARLIDPEASAAAEGRFLRRLRSARSNVPEEGDGQSIFRDRIEKTRSGEKEWLAAWVAARMLGESLSTWLLAGREIDLREEEEINSREFDALLVEAVFRENVGGVEAARWLLAARNRENRFLLCVSESPMTREMVEEAADLDELAKRTGGDILHLHELPMELRRTPARRLIEDGVEEILDPDRPFFQRVRVMLDLLDRTGIDCPAGFRSSGTLLLEREFDRAVRAFFETIEKEGDPEPHMAEARRVRSLAKRRGLDLERSGPDHVLGVTALRFLRRRRVEEPETWAARTVRLLEEAGRIDLSPHPFGFLQDEMIDQIRDGVPGGPEAMRLAERLGFAPGIMRKR